MNKFKKNKFKHNDDRNSDNARSNRSSSNSKRRLKKTEVDISDADINKADLKGITKSSENDGSWYSHYPELVQSFASIPFSYPLGTKMPIPPVTDRDFSVQMSNLFVPGMMSIEWYPVIGQAKGFAADPVNQAANKIYVYVRHTLSTYAQYDATDMMMYILAMDSIFTLYSELVRVYGIALNWKVLNRYYAKAMVQALGIDPVSVLENLASFRGQINEIAYMLNQFVVPAGFDYITRHTWMAGSLFYDGEAVKSQTYFYKMSGFYEFTEVTDGPAYLKFVKRFTTNGGTLTATQAINQLRRCISLVMNSQDCIAMSGDLLKAFGPSGTFVAIPVAENYIVEPIYSKEVLSQIENATILGFPFENNSTSDPWSGNITQQTSLTAGPNIKQNIHFLCGGKSAVTALEMNAILNFHKQEVSPVEVMIATRLMNICDSWGGWPMVNPTTITGNVEATGSEVVSTCNMYEYNSNNADLNELSIVQVLSPMQSSAISAAFLRTWYTFDWAPRLILNSMSSTSASTSVLLDFDNYAVLSQSDLIGLHSTAMMSLFEVPAISKLAVKRFEPRADKH